MNEVGFGPKFAARMTSRHSLHRDEVNFPISEAAASASRSNSVSLGTTAMQMPCRPLGVKSSGRGLPRRHLQQCVVECRTCGVQFRDLEPSDGELDAEV